MKLKSLNKYISLLILLILFTPVNAEDEIDIWNKEIKENSQIKKLNNSKKKLVPKQLVMRGYRIIQKLKMKY